MRTDVFWQDASDLVRLLVVGPVAYVALILILRFGGKRMLSKMNAFDLVVTIALGSVLATILLSKKVALSEGVLALTLLIAMQYLVAWTTARWRFMQNITTAAPTLLLFRGAFLKAAMHDENVSEEAVRAAIRSAGMKSIDEVEAVVLESDGSLSVVHSRGPDGQSALHGVKDAPSGPRA